MLRCRDIGQLLYDHIEGCLEPAVSQQLEQHLADCPGCVAFIRTYKETTRLSKDLRCEDIPPELQQKLHDFIKTKLASPRPGFWHRLRARLPGSQ